MPLQNNDWRTKMILRNWLFKWDLTTRDMSAYVTFKLALVRAGITSLSNISYIFASFQNYALRNLMFFVVIAGTLEYFLPATVFTDYLHIYMYCDLNQYSLYYSSTTVMRVLYRRVPSTRYTVHNRILL